MNKLKLGLAFIFMAAGMAGFILLRDSATVVRVLSILLGLLGRDNSGVVYDTGKGVLHVYVRNHLKRPKRWCGQRARKQSKLQVLYLPS